MDIVGMLKNGFLAIANYFGWVTEKLTLNNTPEMKLAAAQQLEQDRKDKITKMVADCSETDIKRELAE